MINRKDWRITIKLHFENLSIFFKKRTYTHARTAPPLLRAPSPCSLLFGFQWWIDLYEKENIECWRNKCKYSHKKRKDSLEDSLDQVLLMAELEFPKTLVPRLPQHTSNINIKCAESQNVQSNSVIYMWPAFWSTDTS